MLLVKTKIGPSGIHGTGLFADQYIPKGTQIWKFTDGFDQKFTREQILGFPELLQIYLYKYSWRSKSTGLYCFSSDNGKYFNHSNNPNCLSEYGGVITRLLPLPFEIFKLMKRLQIITPLLKRNRVMAMY